MFLYFSTYIGANPVSAADDPSVFKASALFKILETEMINDADNLIEKVRGIFCFKVKNANGKEGMWIINAKTGKGSVQYNGKGIMQN
jgi:sterol carrier protein 2